MKLLLEERDSNVLASIKNRVIDNWHEKNVLVKNELALLPTSSKYMFKDLSKIGVAIVLGMIKY